MEESRVNKYKDYRMSLSKDNAQFLESSKEVTKTVRQSFDTTSTLPIDEVITHLNSDEKQVIFLRRKRLKKTILIIGLSLLGILIITTFIITAIIVF